MLQWVRAMLTILLLCLVTPQSAVAARWTASEIVKPPVFNALIRELSGGHVMQPADNRTGKLAWGDSYVMESYLVMYESTGETTYLDLLIGHADAVLAGRDSERGWTDYAGRSLPGWQAAGHYSIGEVELPSVSGRSGMYLRVSSTGHNEKTGVHVEPTDTSRGLFDLRIVNTHNGYDHTFTNVSMDPDHERYAVRVLNASDLADPWGGVRLYAEDRGAADLEEVRSGLAAGAFSMTPPPYHWPVHQGRITYPLITFARLVYEDPVLSGIPKYKERADAYIQATIAVLDFLEDEWRENESGEGWYVVSRGAPIWMDGADEPHNHSLSVGRSVIQLAAVTKDEKWRIRAEKMARTIHNDLQLLPNGSYTWPYWWSKGDAYHGWSPSDDVSSNTPALRPRPTPEDVSHGSIEVEFAHLAFENGIVFTETDMERLARTFMENILIPRSDGSMTLARFVDGSGTPSFYDDTVAARYLVLGAWDPGIYDAVLRIYSTKGLRAYAGDLLGVARLNWARSRRENTAVQEGSAPLGTRASPRLTLLNPAPGVHQLTRVSGNLPVELKVWAAPGREIERLSMSIGGEVIYRGENAPPPGELVVDTFALSDGAQTMDIVAVDNQGGRTTHSVTFVVSNRWGRQTPLDPPANTMFGLIDRTLIYERSDGWRHASKEEGVLFGDEGRMIYERQGPGHLVWESPETKKRPEIEEFTLHLYVQGVRPEETLSVALSWEREHWTDVPYDVHVVDTSSQWQHLELSGDVQAPVGGRYLRVTVARDSGAGMVQLGSVRFGGLWRGE